MQSLGAFPVATRGGVFGSAAHPTAWVAEGREPKQAPSAVALRALLKAFNELYDGRKYSDLIVQSTDKEHHVHKAIVCPRSAFFAKACEGAFKEARTGVINLLDDDPLAVQLMVDYFYHLNYHISWYRGCSKNTQPKSPTIEEDASSEDALWRRESEDEKSTRSANERPLPKLTIHATVFALAEKYAVEDLMELALDKFKEEAETNWNPVDFLQAAEVVYTTTTEEVRGMRTAVLDILYQYPSILVKPEGQKLAKNVGDLTFDALMHMVARRASW